VLLEEVLDISEIIYVGELVQVNFFFFVLLVTVSMHMVMFVLMSCRVRFFLAEGVFFL